MIIPAIIFLCSAAAAVYAVYTVGRRKSTVEQVIDEIKARGAYIRCTITEVNLDVLVPEDRITDFIEWAKGRNCRVTVL